MSLSICRVCGSELDYTNGICMGMDAEQCRDLFVDRFRHCDTTKAWAEVAKARAEKHNAERQFEDSVLYANRLAEIARERMAILSELRCIVPCGHIPSHTIENLPGHVRDFLAELCELNAREDRSAEWQARAEKADAELAVAIKHLREATVFLEHTFECTDDGFISDYKAFLRVNGIEPFRSYSEYLGIPDIVLSVKDVGACP